MNKLVFFCCITVTTAFCQDKEVDSLRLRLNSLQPNSENIAPDSLRHSLIKELMKRYMDLNVDSSFHYNSLLLALYQKNGMKKELAYAFQYKGYLYQVKGDYHQSIRYFYKALSVAEKNLQYKQIAGAHRGLAHAYSSLKEYKKASAQCNQGLAALKKDEDSYIRLGILNVQGAIFREQSKLPDALRVNRQMYVLAKQKHEQWYESQGLHAIGWVYKEMKDLERSLGYHQRALKLSRQIGSLDLECSILLNIADTYFQREDWEKALKYCKLAKQTAERIKNSSIITESEEKLYQIYKKTKQPAKSLEAFERFVFLRDSLSKEKTDQRIESLQAQYDNIQKTNALQRQQVQLLAEQNNNQQLSQTRNGLSIGIFSVLIIAVLLWGNNRRLQAKNDQIQHQSALLDKARLQLASVNTTLESRVLERTIELSNANKELVRKNEEIKEALFKGQKIERKRVALELHDNLSSLLSAVNMSIQSINPRNLSELEQLVYQNVKQMIQNAYSEVRNISHNILPPELEQEGLITTLQNLISKMNQTSGLQLLMSTENLTDRLPIEIEFNLYSIILELINNTIKHSKAKNLVILILKTNYGVELSVRDNGIGLHQHQGRQGTGLMNIHTRLEAIGGTFDIQVPEENGTWILIKIPIEMIQINGDLPVQSSL